MVILAFLLLLSTASGTFSIPIPENGFEFKGGAPATLGFFLSPSSISLSSSQGYAGVSLRNGEPVVQFGAAQSYECISGAPNTARVLYNKGIAFLNGTVVKGPIPGEGDYHGCEIESTVNTEPRYSKINIIINGEKQFASGTASSCPETLDTTTATTILRLESALPNLVGKNCMPLYNLNSSSQFMSESNTIPINSTFPTFKNKGGPVGFGGTLLYPQFSFSPSPQMVKGGYQTDSGFSNLEYLGDYKFGVEMGRYTSWECTGRNQYIATLEARYFYPDGTVEAEARCEVGRYDSILNSLYYQSSTTACPQPNNATVGQEYFEGSGKYNACADYYPDSSAFAAKVVFVAMIMALVL